MNKQTKEQQIESMGVRYNNLLNDFHRVSNERSTLIKDFKIFKIKTHLINNGVSEDIAKIMAVDSYNMSREVYQ
tara:strand:+ start:756 stop:977 length:222 start_codon:yes stop_codon:yes gene_type:complete